jgi:hypothetical protein
MAGTIVRALVVLFGCSYGLGVIRELLSRRRRERKVGALRDRLLKSGIDIKHRRAARLRPQ